MSKTTKELPPGLPGKEVGAFSCVGDLLATLGRTASDREAILAPGCPPMTYGALCALTNNLVRKLRTLGVGRTDRVAVVLPNGLEAAATMIAVAAGAVCVPLNPGFTADEWRRYFGDLRVSVLLTRADMDTASRGAAHNLGMSIIDVSSHEGADAPGTGWVLSDELASSTDDAFILLTSGTSSRPKMVPLTHAAVCRSAHNVGATLALGAQDRLLNVLPLFHVHGLVSGLVAALAAGSSVVCTPGFDGSAFFGWLKEFRPTWYTAVPAIHRAVLSAAGGYTRSTEPCSLRVVRSASSTLPPDVTDALKALFGVPVIDTYGMTEAASQIAANPMGRCKPGSVGRSAGAEVAIIDREGRLLPACRRGEIAVRGPTITRGYDNDPAATETAFRDGWFRTGDLGYLDPDGYLFIVGRIKDIINRGGQKVAPTEVEQALLRHVDVVDAAVFSVPHKRLGEDVAAAVVLRKDAKASAHSLRVFARARLARYKVPGLIHFVPEIPKGPAGKIKRDELALSTTLTTARVKGGGDSVAPRSELERQLATFWEDLLELNQIGIDEDVFALGADSITVMQMVSRLRARFDVEFSFKDIFNAPTIAVLAARLESAEKSAAMSLSTCDHESTDTRNFGLSFQQQRIYLLSKLDPTGYHYHVVEVARLSGRLDIDVLDASIATICKRHEVLTSTFVERLGEPIQRVRTACPLLERLNLAPCAKERRAATIQEQAQKLLRETFDLEKEPLLRAQLLRLGEDDHALVIKLHHLITDGWSQRLFWEELEAHYESTLNGIPSGLPELPIQYRNFATWQRAWLRTRAADEQLNYWRAQLNGLTELPLRTDRPRPHRWTGRGVRYPIKLPRSLSHSIKSLSRDHGATLFMTLLAAFKSVLYRYTDHDDIAIGSMISNRSQIQIERLIGMFANTVVLRTDLSGDPGFSEVLARVRQVTLDAYRNQDLPIELILQGLQVTRSPGRNPLFQVMFNLQNAQSTAIALGEVSSNFVDLDPEIARFDLTLEIFDADEGLDGWFEYSTDLFDTATIARIAVHLETLLEGVVANPEERISQLPLLPSQERRRILVEWNGIDTSLDGFRTFRECFANQVEHTPDAQAVSTGEVRLSYRELALRSSAVADRLARAGIGPDELVILLAERNVDFLAAVIGVQRAGGAFLCLDPTFPLARVGQIIQHSRAPLVLASEDWAAALAEPLSRMPPRQRPQVLLLKELSQAVSVDHACSVRPVPSGLVCVVYTSGSTGLPKGAMIEQQGMLNHLLSKISDLGLSASDVIAQTAPQSFVISIWQFLAPLMVGARVHICANEVVRDPALLVQEIVREGVTVLQVVPAMLRAILERACHEPAFEALSRLRWMISTGETLPSDLCRDWFRRFPNVPLMNAYGASECSDDVATHRLLASQASHATVPIGRPIPNTRLYVLDAHLQPVPVGVAGELYVGGIGVGRGYLNDPEQTRRSFLSDPFSNREGARLYRTGDLARWCAEGTLECLGRIDHQVKIRGYRIELEEIEHVLLRHQDVKAAVVLVRDDLGGEARLVAHIVTAATRQPDVDALRDFLKTQLPNYMIPSGFIFLERIPLTAHGKIDRSALMAIRDGIRAAGSGYVAPRNSTEEVVAAIWADVLELEDIGVFDNFFDLGGHSLLAGQVLARVMDAFKVSLPIRALFEAPTIAALARRVDEAHDTQPNEPHLDIAHAGGDTAPSIMQEHMLRSERKLPGLPRFNLPFAFRLRGGLNVPALERSLTEVVRRHDSLRTRFDWIDEQPVAFVVPADAVDLCLAVEDLAAWTSNKPDCATTPLVKEAELRAELEAWTPFDMTRAPLFRARLLRLGLDDHVLLLTFHHVIVDGWSIRVFIEEVSELYCAFATGRPAKLPEPGLQFFDFARWQRRWSTTDSATRQFGYWKEHLRGASAVFPTDRDHGGAPLSSPIAHEPVHLPNDLAARLSFLSRNHGATLFMTLLTGLKALLLARSGHTDICVATAMANRSQQRMERMIGPVANTTLIRTRIDTGLSFEDALKRVRESVLEAHARQALPFEILAIRLAEEGRLDPGSMIQVFFLLQNASRLSLKLPDVAVQSFGDLHREGQPVMPIDRTWLTMMLKPTSAGITGSCSFKSNLFESGTPQCWIADFKMILARAAADPTASLGRLAEH